jgi:hypothetical protein
MVFQRHRPNSAASGRKERATSDQPTDPATHPPRTDPPEPSIYTFDAAVQGRRISRCCSRSTILRIRGRHRHFGHEEHTIGQPPARHSRPERFCQFLFAHVLAVLRRDDQLAALPAWGVRHRRQPLSSQRAARRQCTRCRDHANSSQPIAHALHSTKWLAKPHRCTTLCGPSVALVLSTVPKSVAWGGQTKHAAG